MISRRRILSAGRDSERRAFTLTELVIVVAVIGVLASLTVAGIWLAVGTQRLHNTEATLQSVQQLEAANLADVEAGEAVKQVFGSVLPASLRIGVSTSITPRSAKK